METFIGVFPVILPLVRFVVLRLQMVSVLKVETFLCREGTAKRSWAFSSKKHFLERFLRILPPKSPLKEGASPEFFVLPFTL